MISTSKQSSIGKTSKNGMNKRGAAELAGGFAILLVFDYIANGSWRKGRSVICVECQSYNHDACEGGTWCDCQHKVEDNLQLDLATAIGRIEQLYGDGPDKARDPGLRALLKHRLITCDVPRLRKYLSTEMATRLAEAKNANRL